jgi:glycosyltransferase involved in cell wall biosynthesis
MQDVITTVEETHKKISILIPFYNEEDVLPILFERIDNFINARTEYHWEILMVNDGSSDRSLDLVKAKHEKDNRWRYVDLSRNFGKETAMMAGFDYVTGDCVVIMDADLQDPPELIDEMVALWLQGYDDIYGRRRTRGREPWLRKKLTLLYYNILQHLTKIPVLQNTGDFRLMDRICIEALKQMRETQRYTKGLYCWIGFKKAEVLFDRDDRAAGSSKWNFFKLLSLAIEGITSYTTVPLRIATVMGLVTSLGSLVMMLYYLIKTILWDDPVSGFPTMIVVMLFLGGLILFSLGILGEYIGRIFNEVKGRPAYFVREVDGKLSSKDSMFH